MSQQLPTITVIIFTYNYSRFLPSVLASVAEQTLTPTRIVVSDDCSPKETLAEVQAACAGFGGVEVIRNPENLGNIEHYRARVNEITTDAYLLLSADDYLSDPAFLADAAALMAKSDELVAVYGYHVPVDEHERPLLVRQHASDRDVTHLPAQVLRDELAIENTVPAICILVRTSVHEHVGPYPLLNRHCGDWLQFYLFTFHGDFARIERDVLNYRLHGGNMSIGYEAARAIANFIDEGYETLLARHEPSAHDRDRLNLGRQRARFRHAGVRELPGVIARTKPSAATASMLVETLAVRIARKAGKIATDRRRAFFGEGRSMM